MKKKTIIIILVIIFAAVIFFLWRRKKRNSSNAGVSQSVSGSSGTSTKWKGDDFPLTLYSSGNRVKNVQNWWNAFAKETNKMGRFEELPILTVDGKWGSKTEAAMKRVNLYADDGKLSQQDYNDLMSESAAETGRQAAQTASAQIASATQQVVGGGLGYSFNTSRIY